LGGRGREATKGKGFSKGGEKAGGRKSRVVLKQQGATPGKARLLKTTKTYIFI
jgi:hypothetical protein